MSSDKHSFKITDERLAWERTDPWETPEAPEESSDGDGEGETVVESAERHRTPMIATAGAIAGGLLGTLVTVVVTLSSPPGSAPPRPPVHQAPAHRKSSAVVLVPAASAHKSHPKVAKNKSHLKVIRKTHEAKARRKHTSKHASKHTSKRIQPASTKHIRYRPRKHDLHPAHHRPRHSK